MYLLDFSFDDELDDYPDSYVVYRLAEEARLKLDEDWLNLGQGAQRIGAIAVGMVKFDETKRKFLDETAFDHFLE